MKYLQFNWLIRSIIDRCVKEAIKSYAKGKMLDVGCGTKPYKKIAEPFVTEHIGLDREDTIHNKGNIDIFAEAGHIPFPDNCFDTILATAIIEHVEEPAKVISEINRVLKKGGYCIIIAPFVWHLHETPRDFYRFTEYGLRHLFNAYGEWEIIFLAPIAGFWVTLTQLLSYKLYRILRRAHPILTVPLQICGLLLEKIDMDTSLNAEYYVLARKTK